MDENVYACVPPPDNLPGLDGFSEDAIGSLRLANMWALRLSHFYTATHHLLLGIVSNPSAHAKPVLRQHGLSETTVLSSVKKHDPEGPDYCLLGGTLGKTQPWYDTLIAANRLRELSQQELINSTHLLAALMKCGEPIIGLILHDCGTARNSLSSAALDSIGLTDTMQA
jgi:ATP-dependent Clp protease ATP-binding subunit ClpA